MEMHVQGIELSVEFFKMVMECTAQLIILCNNVLTTGHIKQLIAQYMKWQNIRWLDWFLSKGEDRMQRRAEKCFEVQDIRTSENFKSVFITIESVVGLWFGVWRQKNQDSTWEMLPNALIRRFQESYGSNILE
ncbi:hypothetical protein A2U01_0025204, partial [Trifolium medium]|nr:hypothetical protein [Trifolium medium]